MKKFVFLICLVCLFAAPALAQKADNQASEKQNTPQNLLQYTHMGEMPEIKELDKSEDDLYSGAAEDAVEIKISEEEKMQNLAADFDYIDKEYELPELLCENSKLTRQVARFIQNKTQDENQGSVKNRRGRLLMIKNLHNFTELSKEELDKQNNFKTKAAILHLKINESEKIYKVCESSGNNFGKFKNIYLVIYPYFKYYKVVVANVMSSPEKINEASFIYSW